MERGENWEQKKKEKRRKRIEEEEIGQKEMRRTIEGRGQILLQEEMIFKCEK